MATIPTLSYLESGESVIQQLITTPLPATADRIEIAETCAARVSVLVETDDSETQSALCQRLSQDLRQLRERYDADLPPQLVAPLIAGEKLTSCVPDCWQDPLTQVDYALALTQAIAGGTLTSSVATELTRLLHDMVWLLAEFVKEPHGAAH